MSTLKYYGSLISGTQPMGYSYSIEAATHASESSPFYKGGRVAGIWFPSRQVLRFSFPCLIRVPVSNSSECETPQTYRFTTLIGHNVFHINHCATTQIPEIYVAA